MLGFVERAEGDRPEQQHGDEGGDERVGRDGPHLHEVVAKQPRKKKRKGKDEPRCDEGEERPVVEVEPGSERGEDEPPQRARKGDRETAPEPRIGSDPLVMQRSFEVHDPPAP